MSTHYQGPASLPSDYALLSRYAKHCSNGVDTVSDVSDAEQSSSPTSYPRRRLSMPPSQYKPLRVSIYLDYTPPQSYASIPMPCTGSSEDTPLLNPPLPRISESSNSGLSDHGKLFVLIEELRILIRYSFPVCGSHLLEFSIIMVSVISIGHLSTTALAAITLGSMTANVSAFSIIQGFASALDTILPPAWTSSNPELVGLWSQRMVVVMATVLIPIYCTWFNSERILLFLKQDPEVARLAALYLRWLSLGLPAYAFNCTSRRYFQSQGLFAIPTQIIIIAAPINVVLNYLLVWGPPQMRLGFIGAPIATAISFNLISAMSIIYGVFYVNRRAWYPLSSRMFSSLGILVHLGFAGVGQTASEWWAWELISLAASLLGPVSLATQSIVLVSASATYQAPLALGVATSVRIGNLLGEANARRAKIACITAILMAFVLACLWSTMFYAFRNSWAYLFNNDTEVVALTATILPLVALFQVFDGISAVTSGILRARGKQVTGALLNLSAYYIIGIPLAMYLAFSWKLNLRGLWTGLTVSLVYASVLSTWLCLRTDWEHEVRKVLRRLEERDKVQQQNPQAERV